MDSSAELPSEVRAMVRWLPPVGAPVVPGSTPVVAFGDPRRAEIATLGINPSQAEFLDDDGALLSGERRRLATVDSLGADRLDQLSDAQVAHVVAECEAYFRRRPYRRWFDPLDGVVRAATGCSYYDGTACHLDLVQWATDPVWGRITDRAIQQRLLDDGVPHLRAQLARDNVRLVLLNGRQVLHQVVASGLTTLVKVGSLLRPPQPCHLYVGDGSGVRWIGWSTNLQSSFGVSTAFKQNLAEHIADLDRSSEDAPDTGHDGDDGYLPHGMRVASKQEMVDVLADWLLRSRAPTIGDVAAFGGQPWLWIDLPGREIALNADTTRAAVENVVHSAETTPQRPWRVVANRLGRINKVIPHDTAEPLPGWYAYLTRSLDTEETI